MPGDISLAHTASRSPVSPDSDASSPAVAWSFRVRADAVLSGAQRVEKIEYGQCGLPVSHVQPPEE